MTVATPTPRKIHPQAIRARRNRRLLLVALALAAAAAAYGWSWWTHDRFWVRTDNAYVTGNLIPVAAQASGIVTQVLAEETQFVNRGDVLVRLDEHEAYAALGRARGRLGEEVRRITALFKTRKQLEERLAARQARLTLVRHDLERYRRASPAGAVSGQILQNAADQAHALEAEVREARAELDILDARVGGTSIREHPAVELAKHELIQAYLDYKRQQILAPVSGYVAKRKAQVGDRVTPGADLMTIVPLAHLWIEANLRETDLHRVRPGQPALVSVDLYGAEHTFHGVVEGLVPGTGSAFALLPPDNATGNFIHIVERVPVRIALQEDEVRDHPLRPGLSTVTQIRVDQPGRSVLDAVAFAHGPDEASRAQAEAGQSVLTSFAAPSAPEYRTDVYADEIPTAESLADTVITTNLVAEEVGGRALAKAAEQDRPRTAPPREDGDGGREREPVTRSATRTEPRAKVLRSDEPSLGSHVPPRSPDLGVAEHPLSPSIGPGSGLLGPEAGRGPAPLRAGDGNDDGGKAAGIGGRR